MLLALDDLAAVRDPLEPNAQIAELAPRDQLCEFIILLHYGLVIWMRASPEEQQLLADPPQDRTVSR